MQLGTGPLALTTTLAAAALLVAVWHRGKRRGPSGLVRVTYWAGRGRCEPLRCILAAGGLDFTQRFFTEATGKQQLATLRASGMLQYDQVPLVEIDGLALVQGTATANYLGTRLGLMPSNARDAYTVQHVYAAAQDARACLLGFPFADYPNEPGQATFDRVLAECQGPKGLLGRFAPKWEAMLEGSGGPFFLGDRPSIGDVAVFEVSDYFRDVFGPDAFGTHFAPFPKLLDLIVATKALGRLADHCDVGRTKYATWDPVTKTHACWQKYARDVRTTLS